jgi:hypothetical protein
LFDRRSLIFLIAVVTVLGRFSKSETISRPSSTLTMSAMSLNASPSISSMTRSPLSAAWRQPIGHEFST